MPWEQSYSAHHLLHVLPLAMFFYFTRKKSKKRQVLIKFDEFVPIENRWSEGNRSIIRFYWWEYGGMRKASVRWGRLCSAAVNVIITRTGSVVEQLESTLWSLTSFVALLSHWKRPDIWHSPTRVRSAPTNISHYPTLLELQMTLTLPHCTYEESNHSSPFSSL